jgi:hypothetical protein
MAGLEDYRTPEELARQCGEDAYVTQVMAEAVDAGAHLLAAMALGEPQDVVELWTDKVWNGLRDNLDGEERLHAIVLLLSDRIWEASQQVVGSVPLDGEQR